MAVPFTSRLLLACVAFSVPVFGANYSVAILQRGATPALSLANPVGSGYSPCVFSFNPGWIIASETVPKTAILFRAAQCPTAFGGTVDHLLLAYCDGNGVCNDAQPYPSNLPANTQDPRIIYEEGTGCYLMYVFAPGTGQSTVYLYQSPTPLDGHSWALLAGPLPWHRNGCVILRDDGTHYVIFGEAGPLPGLGIATTKDFVNYTVLNTTWLVKDPLQGEVVIEASTAPIRLSTGDYLFFYSAGTTGWVANGNYTGGWLILSGANPTVILQHSKQHLFVASTDYEIGNGKYPVQRNRTIFVTATVPVAGSVDKFRCESQRRRHASRIDW